MLERVRTLWRITYKDKVRFETRPMSPAVGDPAGIASRFDFWKHGQLRVDDSDDDSEAELGLQDELEAYLNQPRAGRHERGVYEWWDARKMEFPSLSRMAFDLLSIPAMSAECERVFSRYSLLVFIQSWSLTNY